MLQFLKTIKNFFNQPSREYEIEQQFYKKLEDMRQNPEKYKHILKRNSNGSKIPPVSLF